MRVVNCNAFVEKALELEMSREEFTDWKMMRSFQSVSELAVRPGNQSDQHLMLVEGQPVVVCVRKDGVKSGGDLNE